MKSSPTTTAKQKQTVFDIVGRYGYSCTISKVTSKRYSVLITSRYFRCGGFAETDEREGLSFIDPSGGPFISVDTFLNEYHYKLPKRKIKEITNNLDEGIVIVLE